MPGRITSAFISLLALSLVEAVDADGKTLWRVTGSKPKSVRIRY